MKDPSNLDLTQTGGEKIDIKRSKKYLLFPCIYNLETLQYLFNQKTLQMRLDSYKSTMALTKFPNTQGKKASEYLNNKKSQI